MDDRVQQCPNCGAAVLPSARFCVTCGIRLPDAAPASESPSSALGGWAQPAEDVWIGEAPALDDESEQHLAHNFMDDQSAAANDNSDATPNAGKADEPGTSRTDDEETAIVAAVIALPPSDTSNHPGSTPQDAGSAGHMQSTSGAENDAPDQLTADIASSTGGGAQPGTRTEAESGGDADASRPTERSAEEQVGPEGELATMASDSAYAEEPLVEDGAADDESDDFEPAGWNADDEIDDTERADKVSGHVATDDQRASTSGSGDWAAAGPDAGESAGALDRATSLLEELRDLLPQLAAPAASPEPGVDLAALRGRALFARGDRSSDNFASLREVIADAVNRPRDIEVMLRLSQRIDDIDALLKERDRLESAFTELIERLDQ